MIQSLLFPNVSPSEVRQIEQVCDRFEAAWKAGQRPHLEAYLSQAAESLRPTLLRHLLALDWEYRVRAGERPQAAEYEVRFPAIGALIESIDREVAAATAADGRLPHRLGEYRIVRQVGRGGMGLVYEAVHESSGRRVALKLLPGIDLADPTARERFWREAHTTARLQHPNIVQIFEVGEHDGQLFLALEFVAGPTLSDRLREAPQPPRQAAALVETLARAVHHAHEQGIVHRDLKPANVLLTRGHQESASGSNQGASQHGPLEECTPKVTDFGLAHPLGGSDLTATGDIVGTPGYMAPEQAWGKSKRRLVGPGADVYALGAILYATMTGRPPFHGATALEALEQVRSHEPVPPTRLQPKVPPDLETICLKCLEKEPSQRYASAEALAEDLRRFLAGEPIRARRTSQLERLRRWFRRNPAPAAASVLGVVALAAAAGLAVSHAFTVQLRQEQKLTKSALQDAEFQRGRAEDNARGLAKQQGLTQSALVEAEHFRRQAERLSVSLELERALTLLEQEDVARGMLVLGHSLQIAPAGANDLQHVIRSNLAAAYRRLPFNLASVVEQGGEVEAVAFSPDGKVLLTGGKVGGARRWEVASGQPLGEALPHGGEIKAVAFSSDGSLMATAGTDKTARLWEAASGRPFGKPLAHSQWVHAVAFSPDGKTILTGCEDATAQLWDSASGKPLGEPLQHRGPVRTVAFSPDDKTVVTGGAPNSAQFWEQATGKPIGAPMCPQGQVLALTFSPNGRVLVTGSEEGTARLWEADTGNPLGLPLLHQGPVRAVGYSPDGTMLWTGGTYGKVRFWDAVTMSPLGAPVHHQSAVYAVALSRDQKLLATGSADRKVRIWEKPVPSFPSVLLPHKHSVYCVAISPDGKTVATGSAGPSVLLWDAATGKSGSKPLTHQGAVYRVAFSPDGRTVVTGSRDKTARLWDVDEGTPRGPAMKHADEVYAVAFSPDGRTVLTGCKDSTAQLWDVVSGKPSGEPLQHPGWVHAVAFSPDGKTILTGCEDANARLWDAATGEPLGEPLQERGPVRSVAFSPDGRMLLTGTWDDGTARLWDAATRKPLGTPLTHPDHVLTAAFSPDGQTVATGTWDGTARLWDVATGKPLGPPFVHQGTVREVTFSPDGKALWTASFDWTVRSWEQPVPVEGNVRQIVLWIQAVTGMELDNDGLFRDLDAATWRERLTELGGPP